MQERHGRENLTPTGEGEPRPPLRRSVNKETTRDGEEGGTPADAPQLDTRNSELGKKEKRKNGEKEATARRRRSANHTNPRGTSKEE